ncbi:hypothetical protein [Shivajiella indica]|uniref:Uncharacterized protein n=1 Tax=Shivajiella indica TaxID=872115 RepID=A0ABW5B2X6_9BACT
MKRLIHYLKRLGHWLFESYPITIVIVPSMVVFLFRKPLGEEGIQLCGGILQIIGALYGIAIFLKLREVFSFPSLFDLFVGWLKRFPRWKKDVRVMAGTIVAPMALLSAKASVWSPDDPSLPVEERLKRIIRNQESLRESMDLVEQEISKKDTTLTERIKKLDSKFTSEISQVSSKLESIHMEDFFWALSGLLFILVGILFSSFARYIV